MKSYSFIFVDDEVNRTNVNTNNQFIEAIIGILSNSSSQKKYLKGIFETTFKSKEDSIYRMKVIKDIYYNQLYNKIYSIFERYNKLSQDYHMVYNQFIKAKASIENYEMLINDLLKDMALCINKLLEIYDDLYKMFRDNNGNYEALDKLFNIVKKIVNNKSKDCLDKLCDKLQYDYKPKIISVKLDEDQNYRVSKLIFDSNFNLKNYEHRIIKNYFDHEFKYLNNISKIKIIEILNEFFNTLAIFDNCYEELYFIDFGLKLIDIYNITKKPWTFTEFTNIGFSFDDALDPYLLLMMYKEGYINIFSYSINSKDSNASILVTGENNMGKTVFARTIYIIYAFSQVGLPLPARSVELEYKNKLFSCYSKKESFTDPMGRFEKECFEISEVLKEANNKSLVLLNEMFQSTSTKEAEVILFQLLVHLGKVGVSSIIVTHHTNIVKKASDYNRLVGKDVILVHCYNEDNKYLIKVK